MDNKPILRKEYQKLGGETVYCYMPYCPHCNYKLGMLAEIREYERCPMCGKLLDWSYFDIDVTALRAELNID